MNVSLPHARLPSMQYDDEDEMMMKMMGTGQGYRVISHRISWTNSQVSQIV